MIKEDYVSFETAKLLKEKGFDEPSRFWYDNNGVISQKYIDAADKPLGKGTHYHCVTVSFAITLQMAMKWLREKHKLFIDITAAMEDYIENGVVKYKDPYYTWEVFSLEIGETLCFGEAQNVKKSYEAACESAIKYCLENLI